MAIKSLSQITQNLINNIHDTLPDIDTKEGTFIRDVFVNPVSSEISQLYQQILSMQLSQSILTASGKDLDNLAGNYFIDRKQATRSYGSVRFYIKLPVNKEIVISKGTNISTIGSTTNVEKIFETTESAIIPFGYSITDPAKPKVAYVDVLAQSTFAGLNANVGTSDIKKIQSGVDANVIGVENLLPFTGGSDTESDVSLALRVSLAVSGSNIGTKDGYTAFILKQPEVTDARIVAAGETLMKRDGGKGGMVDIYVRANRIEEEIYNLLVNRDYITDRVNTPAYSPIILPMQPVIKINNIKGTIAGTSTVRNYINGSDYKIERISNKYYLDTLWSFTDQQGSGTVVGSLVFSIDGGPVKTVSLNSGQTLDFLVSSINTAVGSNVATNLNGKLSIISPTVGTSSTIDIKSTSTQAIINQLGIPIGVDIGTSTQSATVLGTNTISKILTEDEDAIRVLNASLTIINNSVNYLRDIYADLNWSQIKPDNDVTLPADLNFLRGYDPDDSLVYQLKSRHIYNPGDKIGGRYFVKRYGLIYERIYYNPDYILKRDISNYGYSYKAADSIKWLDTSSNKPGEGETLVINYSYSGVINDLQSRIDQKRVLTADVLLMSARRVGLEIYCTAVPYQNYSADAITSAIKTRLTNYINNTKKLGGVISNSDVAFIIRGTAGVDDIGLDTIKLARVDEMPTKQIIALDYEYLEIDSITIKVFPVGTTV